MRLHTFRGRNLAQVAAQARHELGDDVLIIRTDVGRDGNEPVVEVTAALHDEMETFRQELRPSPIPRPSDSGDGPFVIALVGPAGAGKTTALARLASEPRCFADRSVGILTLDSKRQGAVQSLLPIAKAAGTSLEVVQSAARVQPALKRLRGRDIVLVDTPPLSPRYNDVTLELAAMLLAIQPSETHLVLPANIRADEAAALRRAFSPARPSHLLVSRLDEVCGPQTLMELSAAVRLAIRWISEGLGEHGEIQAGPARILDQLSGGASIRGTEAMVA